MRISTSPATEPRSWISRILNAARHRRVARAVKHRPKLFYLSKRVVVNSRSDIVQLGTYYGGWLVPSSLLAANSVCYCVGVGEDASFDLALIEECGCTVYAFDPTPRSITYVDSHLSAKSRVVFHPYGLWESDGSVRFYVPPNPQHVSHSAVNIRHTDDYIVVEMRSLSSVMHGLGHAAIDLLKMDIEGAEHTVLEDMLEKRIDIRALCVEFDQPMPVHTTLSMIRRLTASGFDLVAVDRWNHTFVNLEQAISTPSSGKEGD